MKNLKIIFLSLSLLSAGFVVSTFTSCSSDEKQGKEYTSAYICPMHCEGSGSDAAGQCPVCGMDYVKKEDHKAAEKNEEGEHNHGDHEGHDH